MCGIFGVIDNQESKKIINDFIELGKKSEARGKEASGYFLAILNQSITLSHHQNSQIGKCQRIKTKYQRSKIKFYYWPYKA